MNEEEIKELEKYLKSLPKISNNMSIPITTNIGINMDDLMNAVKEFKKVPIYDELLRENKKLKQQLEQRDNIINKAREFINEYEKNRNCFKWNEQDYIDTINEIKEILNIDKGE